MLLFPVGRSDSAWPGLPSFIQFIHSSTHSPPPLAPAPSDGVHPARAAQDPRPRRRSPPAATEEEESFIALIRSHERQATHPTTFQVRASLRRIDPTANLAATADEAPREGYGIGRGGMMHEDAPGDGPDKGEKEGEEETHASREREESAALAQRMNSHGRVVLQGRGGAAMGGWGDFKFQTSNFRGGSDFT